MVCDLEAGIGTLLRLKPGQVDLAIVVAQPTVKAIEVARRAVRIAAPHTRVIVVANRVRDKDDLELIRSRVDGADELFAIPDDPAIAHADEDGRAPIDAAPDAPGTRAITELAARVAADDG